MAKQSSDVPSATARLHYKVTGTPNGEVSFSTVIENGIVLESKLGDDPHPDLTLTVAYKDFVKLGNGELDTVVGFMQGRVKLVGSSGTLMTLIPVLRSDAYRSTLGKVGANADG